jgi:hypothetical protein
MEVVPRKCLKCGTEIITTSSEIRPNWVQYFFKLSNGNNVCIAFCKNCDVTKEDFQEIEKALGYSEKKVIGIIKRQTAKEICNERQNEKCFICGKKIENVEDCELSVGGFLRHYSCPVDGHAHDDNLNAGRNSREYGQRNKRRNEYSV